MAGTGLVAYHQARTLAKRGHRVTVFTAQSSPLPEETSVFPFAVEYLPAVFRLGNAPLTPRLWQKLRGFDIIHLHYPYIFGAEMTLAASKRFHIPYVLTYHNQLLQPGSWKQALFSLYNWGVEPAILRHSAAVMAVSLDHFQSLHARALPLKQMVQEVPNGVETDLFRPLKRDLCRLRLGLPLHRFIILFVGALDSAHEFKNVPVLLDAVERVKKIMDITVVIAGGGDRQHDYEEYNPIGGSVKFVGPLRPSVLPDYYNAADVTVLPSSPPESFGMVLVESMACGTPVIASNIPGVRTVVDAGRTGHLVSPGDVGELADAIVRMLGNQAEQKQMRINCPKRVETRYTWPLVGDALERVYTQVLAGTTAVDSKEAPHAG